MFVDSHCHLDKLDYVEKHKDIADVLQKAKDVNVGHVLSVGVTLDAFPKMMDLIAPFDTVSASCGVHPLDVESEFSLDTFYAYCNNPRVVAIGETGLDYHYHPETAALQKLRFTQQVDVAVALNKPLIIHTRNARRDTLDILRKGCAEKCGGVIHCFTENMAFADAVLEIGFYISISGIVTFNQAKELKEVVKGLPLNRMLIETDSPYLAPVPHRGTENQPAHVIEVAAYIAQLKGISIHQVAEQTTKNFRELFLKEKI